MSRIAVRHATEEDLPALTLLMNELGYPTSATEMRERYEQILQQPGYVTLVAEKDGKVVGAAGIIKLFYWEQNGHFLRVQILVVHSNSRRKGIGNMLIQAVEDLGRDSGAVLISLNCGLKEQRAAAHLFYPQAGFEHTSVGYTKWLMD